MKKTHIGFLFFLFIMTGIFVGCESGCNGTGTDVPASSVAEEFEINGNKYIHHIKNGGATPQPTEFVLYHYSMSADDSLLTDSRDINLLNNMQVPPKPADGSKPQKAQPVLDGLKLMSAGDSMTIKIPISSLNQIPMGFSDYEYLIYRIAVKEIQSQEKMMAANMEKAKKIQAQRENDIAREGDVNAFLKQLIQDHKAGNLNDQLIETASGLKYIIHEKGKGKMPKNLNPIKAHYYAMSQDGVPFDNSFRTGNPYFFTLGAAQVYRGWDEGIAKFPIGSKVTLILTPSLLVFGEDKTNPNLPAGSDMYFYIETFYPY